MFHTHNFKWFHCFRISELQLQIQAPASDHGAVNRVQELITTFQNLYNHDREEALEALNNLPELKEVHSLKGKILFSVVVVSMFQHTFR